MAEKNSADVTDRTLTLLWRSALGEPQGSRGPKQKTSVDEVVAAAISIADAEGLAALSMRKVAEQLDLKVMSLYTYVTSKDELVALMIDSAAGEILLPGLTDDLRQRLTAMARMIWDEVRGHAWLLHAQTARPVLGPHLSDRYEWQLAALEGHGLSDVEMDQVVTLITNFAAGAARSAIEQQQLRQRSGISDTQWWETNAPILERLMPPERYPISGRVGQTAGETYNAASNPELSFDFGLERLLDGIGDLIDRAPSRSRNGAGT